MSELKYFYGVYRGICVDNLDPDRKSRIKLQVPQVLGDSITDWAWPIMPVINNANHPDHLPHLASEVAALLQAHATHSTHAGTWTTSSGGSPSHTHTVTYSLAHDAHTNNHTGKTPDTTYKLTHAHETLANTTQLWNDDLEQNLISGGVEPDPIDAGFGTNRPSDSQRVAEHTPHRLVPTVNQGVWVMFEGGDPNFPLWIGVF